jgi:hypothetical protein
VLEVVVLGGSLAATNSCLLGLRLGYLLFGEDMVSFQGVQVVEDIEVAAAAGWVRFVLDIRLLLVGDGHWELVQSSFVIAAAAQVAVSLYLKLAMTPKTWSVSYPLARVSERSSSDFGLEVERHRISKRTRQHCVGLDWLDCSLEVAHCHVHSGSYNPPSGLMAHMREQ